MEEENVILRKKLKAFRKVINPDQEHRLENPESRSHWSDDTMEEAIQYATKMGWDNYEFMRSKQLTCGQPLAQ